ncbi:uncharacterized protein TNIN_232971 [Trichonephila inaurata madagascariensis]|uniref:Uncharacterized protein n=1 Tax=Trichonephila inaurata madagascariensis TaxID=2747483 RepID=A0A8X7CEN2_9ARAC|nr:uncharacterized protein TNIN_232971 [Trichonephila inaurata madagascariensis]
MELIRFWILCFLISVCAVSFVNCNPLDSQLHQAVPFLVEKQDGSSQCDAEEISKWTSEFHECFIDKKYNDGGHNLNSIVERILEHSEACLEIFSKECRPDFEGFKTLLNKTITQMKDYASMYLEEIYKGREKIKDLECVETVLTLHTYEYCFEITYQNPKVSEEDFQEDVKEGIYCTNQANKGCSKEAKTSLNRMVRIILGIAQPFEEIIEDEIKPTEPPPPPPKSDVNANISYIIRAKKSCSGKTEPPFNRMFKIIFGIEQPLEGIIEDTMELIETPPKRWYDYIMQPFITAWRAIVNFFTEG